MRVLIIGYSNIVQRRILPALAQIPQIESVDVASQTSASRISLQEKIEGQIFDNYERALSRSKGDLVYISLVNSAHAEWVEKALQEGFHVVVDKPAFTRIEDAIKLVELSKKSNLCLAESNGYLYHPQIQLIHEIFMKAKTKPTRLTAILSYPPLDPQNFRYKKELGGGTLWDLGPYAVTPGRIFFQEKPREVFCRICTKSQDDAVDTSFSLLAFYPEGRSMVGHFGFTTEYCNHLSLLGPNVSVDIDRLFTTPPEMENEIRVKQNDKKVMVKAPRADSFFIFLLKVIESIQKKNYHLFAEDLLTDASVLHRMRISAHEE